MDSALITALQAAAPTSVILVTVTLPDATIRWTDGGFVVWSGNTYAAEDATYGVLSAVEAIEDGLTDGATVCALTVAPKNFAAVEALSDPEAQGSVVTVHLGAVNRATGVLIGEPELLFRGEIDQPRLGVSEELSLVLDLITQEARMLEPNDQQRLTDAFHSVAFPGERGFENLPKVDKPVYWRADDPRNAVG
jgi:hypothetical protein